jgi:hypothetical protein
MADALEAMEQDKPTQSDQAPAEASAPAQEQTEPEYFSENFDPSTLDESLQPAYKQMQGAWTRKTQELAEQRKQAESVQAAFNDLQSEDPETSQGALNWLTQTGLLNENTLQKVLPAFGYEFDDQTDDQEDEGPQYMTREEYEQSRAQEAENAYVNAVDDHLQSEIEQINSQLKEQGLPELEDDEQQAIVFSALQANQPGQMPDVRSVFDRYQQRLEARMDGRLKGWAGSKRGGATTGGGAAATGVPDLDNTQARREHLAEEIAKWQESVGP